MLYFNIRLLTSNTKLDKGLGQGFRIAGLALAPHRRSGSNVCSHAGLCSVVCNLWFAGRTNAPKTRRAMIRRTRFMVEQPRAFDRQLRQEIESHISCAHRENLIPLLRLNVASDLDWMYLIEDYPECVFYDYTKVISRMGRTPSNYHLTYSYNERSLDAKVNRLLQRGLNVSAIFSSAYVPSAGIRGQLPTHLWIGRKEWPVVDGDTHDIRLPAFDGEGVIVGLRFKGGRKLMQQMIDRGLVIKG